MWACICCSTWRAPSGPIKRGPVRSGPSQRGFEVEAGRVGSSGGPVPGDDVPGRERLRGGQRGQPHGEGPRERATVHAPRGAPHVLHVQPLRRARLHAPFVMSRIKKVHVSARVILIFTAARTIGSTVISRQQTADSARATCTEQHRAPDSLDTTTRPRNPVKSVRDGCQIKSNLKA